jgi:hypothetical protein
VGKFSKIKKSKRISSSIREKIDLLNKELVKTGMLSEITNSTSGVYTVVDYIEPEAAVPPTLSDVPDTTGITGDSFTQPTYGGVMGDDSTWETGWSNNDYLKNPNTLAGETDRPIVVSVPDSPYDSGGAGIALYYGYFGTSVGYAAANGGYKQILVGGLTGGTEDPTSPNARSPLQGGYYGGLTDAQYAYAVGFWTAYRALVNKYGPYNLPGKSVKVWVPYNRFHHFQSGGEFASWTGGPKKSNVSGSFILQNAFIITEPNKYTSDPGSPYQPGYTTVVSRNSLGDPNYYPGPIPPALARGDGKPAPFTEDNYNWYNKVYGLPAAEWYRNNPTRPPSSNPFLPKGAYVPLALGPEIMNRWGMSSQAAQTLIAAGNPLFGGQPGYGGEYGGGPTAAEKSAKNMTWDSHMKMWVPNLGPDQKPGLKGV